MATNEKFANHVQSIAFNLTLSRSMIEALGLLWHHGFLRDNISTFIENKPERWEPSRYVSSHSVPIIHALERRGLVEYHEPPDGRTLEGQKTIWRHKSHILTDAGEKTCELLVCAGLLAAKPVLRKRKAA